MKKTIKACVIAYAIVSALFIFFLAMEITRPEWFGEWLLAFWENLTSESGTIEATWEAFSRSVKIILLVQVVIGVVLAIAAAVCIKTEDSTEETTETTQTTTVKAEEQAKKAARRKKVKKAAVAVAEREADVAQSGKVESAQVKVSSDIEAFLKSL